MLMYEDLKKGLKINKTKIDKVKFDYFFQNCLGNG